MKSIALSVLVLAVSIYLAFNTFFLSFVYFPLVAAALLAAVVFGYRLRILRQRMPVPYGRGRVAKVTVRASMWAGILLTVLGGASLVGIMASVFFLPPFLFFTVVFGVIIGLPLSEVIFFAVTSEYEKKCGSRIYFFSEEGGTDDEPLLLKGVELSDD